MKPNINNIAFKEKSGFSISGGYDRTHIPTPPADRFKYAVYYWTAKIDGDKRLYNIRVLQWNPVKCNWCEQDDLGTGQMPVRDMEGAVILKEAPVPNYPFDISNL